MKHFWKWILSFVCLVSLVGCGGNGNNDKKDNEPKTEVKDENKTETKKNTNKEIAIGETVTTKDIEFTLKGVSFSHDVLPENPSNFYNHYPADPGKVYIYVQVDIKNIGKQDLRSDKIYSVEANYNNGFKYTGWQIAEESGTFTYANITNITPLETSSIPTLIDVPQEVEEQTDNSLTIKITLSDKSVYRYKIR